MGQAKVWPFPLGGKRMAKKKDKEQVKFEGEIYEILERAGETIRIGNEQKEFCILESAVEPVKAKS